MFKVAGAVVCVVLVAGTAPVAAQDVAGGVFKDWHSYYWGSVGGVNLALEKEGAGSNAFDRVSFRLARGVGKPAVAVLGVASDVLLEIEGNYGFNRHFSQLFTNYFTLSEPESISHHVALRANVMWRPEITSGLYVYLGFGAGPSWSYSQTSAYSRCASWQSTNGGPFRCARTSYEPGRKSSYFSFGTQKLIGLVYALTPRLGITVGYRPIASVGLTTLF